MQKESAFFINKLYYSNNCAIDDMIICIADMIIEVSEIFITFIEIFFN